MQLLLDVSSSHALAGFEQAVKESNQSELGRRNSGSMLSVQASERALLCYLMNRLNSLDPDVLVGHNVSAFDLDILLHRLQHHKVKHAQGLTQCCFVLDLQPAAFVCVAITFNHLTCRMRKCITCVSALMLHHLKPMPADSTCAYKGCQLL